MKQVAYLGLVFFLANHSEEIHCLRADRPNTSSGRPPSRYLNFEAPPGPSNNPCDRTKVNKNVPDAHVACHNECMDIKTSIGNFYDLYPEYALIKLLYGKCGSVCEGKCDYFKKAAYYPICFCYTSTGFNLKRRTPLFVCRVGIPVMRMVTNVGIGLTRCASGFSKKAGERPQSGRSRLEQGEQDGEPEGSVLVTDLHISETKIRAIVDTGSGVTVISQKFAKDIRPLDGPRTLSGIITNQLQLFGIATIDVQIKEGITIPVTGLVASIKVDLILGNDFFVKHAAKIKISERIMELSTYQTKVDIPIKFGGPSLPGKIFSARPGPGGYPPLKISGLLNGRETQIMVDTGASSSIIRNDFVNPENVQPLHMLNIAPDGTLVVFKLCTFFELLIEGQKFGCRALIRKSHFSESLITGNDFNKYFVELIDFEQERVTLKQPRTDDRVTTRAFVPYIFPINSTNGV